MFAPLFGCGSPFCFGQRPGTSIGREQCDKIGELLRLESEKLVAGLGRLERACRPLALADQRRNFGAVRVDVADHAGLDAHCVLQSAHGVLPA